MGWILCHREKPDGQKFCQVSDPSQESGPHLPFLTLTFLKTPERSDKLSLTMSLKMDASSQHCSDGHQAVPLSTDTVLLSPPQSSSLLGASSPGGCCLAGWESEQRGQEGYCRGLFTQTSVKPEDCLHSEHRGPLWGLGWARPSDSNSYLPDSVGRAHSHLGLV